MRAKVNKGAFSETVELITEWIAGMSLSTVLLVLMVLTAARMAFRTARAASLRTFGEVLESVLLAFGIVFLVLRPFVVQSYYIPSGSMHPTLWEGDHILVDKLTYRFHAPRRGDVVVFRAPRDASEDEREFIKRVIGLPGDTVEVQEGYVAIGPDRYWRPDIRQCLGESLSVDQMVTEEDSLPPLRLTTDAIWLGGRRISPQEFAAAAGRPGQPVFIHPGRVLRNGAVLMEGYVAEDPQYRLGPIVVPPDHLLVLGDNRNASDDSRYWGCLPASRVVGRADLVFWPLPHFKLLFGGCGQE